MYRRRRKSRHVHSNRPMSKRRRSLAAKKGWARRKRNLSKRGRYRGTMSWAAVARAERAEHRRQMKKNRRRSRRSARRRSRR